MVIYKNPELLVFKNKTEKENDIILIEKLGIEGGNIH